MRTTRISSLRNRKGISTILGVIIFVGLLFSTVVPMYLIMNQADTVYDKKMSEMKRLDDERSIESLAVDVNPISQYSTILNINVSNECVLVVKIVRIWVNDTYSTASAVVQSMSVLSMNLTVVPSLNHTYSFMVATERGNVFAADALFYGESGWVKEPPPEVQASGVSKLDWFYFKYTSYQQQSRTDANIIPKSSTYVAIYFKIMNNWIYPIKIKAETFVTWIVPYIEVTMSIVDHVTYSPTRTITKYTDEIVIQPGETVEIIFAATTKQGTSWVWGSRIPSNLITQNPGSTAYVQLTLFYILLGKTYCQTMTAQGTYFS